MAVNQTRSMNVDLTEGMTDGKYKKIATRERGGVIDPATAANRQALMGNNPLTDYYGMNEAGVMVRPDGKLG